MQCVTYHGTGFTSDSSLIRQSVATKLHPLQWMHLQNRTNTYNIQYLTYESLFPIYQSRTWHNVTVVQTQKVVINTLVYLVCDYYNSSKIKEIEIVRFEYSGLFLYFGIAVNSNFVHNDIHNITSPNTYILAVCGGHFSYTLAVCGGHFSYSCFDFNLSLIHI